MKSFEAVSAVLFATIAEASITQNFMTGVQITHDGTNYGNMTGKTSWEKAGWGLDSTMEYLVEFQLFAEETNGDFWNNYKFQIAMSAATTAQGVAATNAEMIQITADVQANGDIRDDCYMGNLDFPVSSINYVVDQPWPVETYDQSTNTNILKDTSGGSAVEVTYELSTSGATIYGGVPDPNFWGLDLRSGRITEQKSMNLYISRSGEYPGVAGITAGATVDTKIAWSINGEANVKWTTTAQLIWENEYSGGGPGTMAASGVESSESGAVEQFTAGSMLFVSTVLALLMW